MRDQYNASQVGVMGNCAGNNAIIIQRSSEQKLNRSDLSALSQEISTIREHIKNDSSMDDDFKDIMTGNLAEINIAIKEEILPR